MQGLININPDKPKTDQMSNPVIDLDSHIGSLNVELVLFKLQ